MACPGLSRLIEKGAPDAGKAKWDADMPRASEQVCQMLAAAGIDECWNGLYVRDCALPEDPAYAGHAFVAVLIDGQPVEEGHVKCRNLLVRPAAIVSPGGSQTAPPWLLQVELDPVDDVLWVAHTRVVRNLAVAVGAGDGPSCGACLDTIRKGQGTWLRVPLTDHEQRAALAKVQARRP